MKGFIYKISQDDKCYYGSTVRDPIIRLKEHERHSKYNLPNLTKSEILFNNYDFPPLFKIIAEVEFEDIQDLKDIEYYYIEKDNTCVNVSRKPDPNGVWVKNKLRMQQYRKNKSFDCDCGCKINYFSRNKHLVTKKHFKLLNKKIEENKKKICTVIL